MIEMYACRKAAVVPDIDSLGFAVTVPGSMASQLTTSWLPCASSPANARWLESVTLSGSLPKGTALRDSDVDLFLSLSHATKEGYVVFEAGHWAGG